MNAARRFFPRARSCAVALLAAGAALLAQEVQKHGLVFEDWIRTTFFDGYRPASYTQLWDIPAAANKTHGGIPVNPKAIKYGSPLDFGDALRQAAIDEPFLLVVGFWQQQGDEKRFVNLVAQRVEPTTWHRLWFPIKPADLERLDAVIKDRSLTPDQARAAAQKIKNAPPFTKSIMQVNPKIDAHTQRRLQCSLRFEDFFKHVAPGAVKGVLPHPKLWDVEFPQPIASKTREFKRDAPEEKKRK
jgi:hypothetical protein